MTRVLLTGGCGFIGHHVVEHFLKKTDWDLVVLDKLSYASRGFDRLREIQAYDDKRVHRLTHNFTLPIEDGIAYEIGKPDYILHLGAETHVENSISDPKLFVYSNLLGTMEMLEYARRLPELKAFVYFSTDEVFGPAPDGVLYREWDRYDSRNPYAATKAGGEELALAWANTYKLPIIVTHCMNVFGERQHAEKFIPMCIRKVLSGERIAIHADSTKTRSGSRCWIHARNVADALLFLLGRKLRFRDKFNIVGEELANYEIAKAIADFLGKTLNFELVDFHSSRPGHDLRYGLDPSYMLALGWKPPVEIHDSLRKTVQWFLDNPQWLGGFPNGSEQPHVS